MMLAVRSGIILAVAAIASGTAQTGIASELRYRVTDLGTPPGFSTSYPTGLNNRGDVVGVTWRASRDGMWGFLYSNGSMGFTPADSPFTPGLRIASDINDSGQLPPHEDYTAINNQGHIAGSWRTYDSRGWPSSMAYSSHSGALFDHDGDVSSVAVDINDSNQVVGVRWSSSQAEGHGGVYLFDDGRVVDLGIGVSGYDAQSLAINNRGAIAGTRSERAFRWKDGRLTELGTLDGGETRAEDINDDGWIVGSSRMEGGLVYYHPELQTTIHEGLFHGFLAVDDQVFDLNDLVPPTTDWTITGAAAINESGQIAATGFRDGISHALLLTPVPEPTAFALLAIAAAAVACRSSLASRRANPAPGPRVR